MFIDAIINESFGSRRRCLLKVNIGNETLQTSVLLSYRRHLQPGSPAKKESTFSSEYSALLFELMFTVLHEMENIL